MNRKAFGVTLLAVAFVSSAAWATGWHRGDDRDRDRDHHHHRDHDHPSHAWEKNPIFKKLFGGGSGSGGGTTDPGTSDPGTSNPGTVTYDYRSYIEADTISTKVFATTGIPSGAVCGNTEVRSYVRQSEASGTRITETRVQSSATGNCQCDKLEHRATEAGYVLEQVDRHDPNCMSALYQRVVEQPVAVYPGAVAGNWGSASTVKDTNGTTIGQLIEAGMLLGVETVTVPAGTYDNCLKIQHSRTSNQPYLGNYSAISWVCPGIGEVKRVQGSPFRNNVEIAQMAEWVLTQVQAGP